MKIAVIGGDGIGPEVIKESLKVLNSLKNKFHFSCEVEEFPFGAEYYMETGISIPGGFFQKLDQEYSAVLFGAVGDSRVKSTQYAKDILLGMRSKMDLFVNYRPIKLLNQSYCPLKNVSERDVDFVIFRENTEDSYLAAGGTLKKGTENEVVVENAIHTRVGVERIIRYAFDFARINQRQSVLMSNKSNVMKYSGSLWNRVFQEVGEQYPEIEKRHMLIDALHMEILRDPSQFEVIVTTNVFGDILTDMCAQLQGGMGLAPSGNLNPTKKVFHGLYEPIHGSAPDIAGKQLANPIASILSLSMMLRDLRHGDEADAIDAAIAFVLKEGIVTKDLGGKSATQEVGDAIAEFIDNM